MIFIWYLMIWKYLFKRKNGVDCRIHISRSRSSSVSDNNNIVDIIAVRTWLCTFIRTFSATTRHHERETLPLFALLCHHLHVVIIIIVVIIASSILHRLQPQSVTFHYLPTSSCINFFIAASAVNASYAKCDINLQKCKQRRDAVRMNVVITYAKLSIGMDWSNSMSWEGERKMLLLLFETFRNEMSWVRSLHIIRYACLVLHKIKINFSFAFIYFSLFFIIFSAIERD